MRRQIYLSLLLSTLQVLVTATCYYPDGTEGTELIPCNEDAEVSHCCRSGDVCLSNRLCFSSGLGAVIRRGCTSQDWNSTACPSICTDDVFRKGDAVLTGCGQYNQFCCGQSKEARACCDSGNSSEIIIVPAGDLMGNDTTGSPTPLPPSNNTTLTDPTSKSEISKLKHDIKKKNTTIYALASVFGVAMIAVIVMGVMLYKNRGLKGPPPRLNVAQGTAVGGQQAHRMSVLPSPGPRL